jgi:hypothetical protein
LSFNRIVHNISHFLEREEIACGAAVPALGLSNKAVFVEDNNISADEPRHPNDEYAEVSFSPQILSGIILDSI